MFDILIVSYHKAEINAWFDKLHCNVLLYTMKRGDLSVKKQDILKLLLICAFAVMVYLADVYLIVPSVERNTMEVEHTGVRIHGE